MLQPIHRLARAGSMLMLVWQVMNFLRDTVQELLPMLRVRTVIPRVSRRSLIMMLLIRTIMPTDRMLLSLDPEIIMMITKLIALNLLIQQ
jgi:hypothetical protein